MTNEAQDRPVLSANDRALLDATVSPSDDQLAATRRAIGARIAALAAGAAVTQAVSSAHATGTATVATAGASTAPAAAAATTGFAALGAAKWIGAGLIVTALASGAVVATRQQHRTEQQHASASAVAQPSRAALPVSAPAPVESAAPTAARAAQLVQPNEPAVAIEAPTPARAVPAKRGERRASSELNPARSGGGETLSGELTLLHGARQALARGDASAALQALDAHAERYPNAMLRQEALSARALALCEAGRTSEARRTANLLARIAPRSPHLIRLADSCALEDTADAKQ
jgi:hypothetical protein